MQPRHVLITGASRGIGRGTALHLSRAGWSVHAAVRRHEDGVRLEQESEGRIQPIRLDVSDDESIELAHKSLEQAVGDAGLSGLVNNAGIGAVAPLEYVTREKLDEAFAVNFQGMVMTTRAMLPLIHRARGRIVNIGGGGAAYLGFPLMGALAATKYAVEAMTDALRVELRGAGIRVSLIEPGMTYSDRDKDRFLQESNAAFEAASARLPDEGRRRYAEPLEKMREFNASFLAKAVPAEFVARRIEHALTSSRPRSRYYCGSETWVGILISKLLPSRARDALWGHITGL